VVLLYNSDIPGHALETLMRELSAPGKGAGKRCETFAAGASEGCQK